MTPTERKRLWREQNRERDRQYQKDYRASRVEQEAERKKRWLEQNAERSREYQQDWYQRNRERVLTQQREHYREDIDRSRLLGVLKAERRRARIAGALTAQEWAELLDEFDHACAYCSDRGPLAQEHMTPLAQGGLHVKSNVVPACKSCNSSKGAKTLFQYAAVVPIKLRAPV